MFIFLNNHLWNIFGILGMSAVEHPDGHIAIAIQSEHEKIESSEDELSLPNLTISTNTRAVPIQVINHWKKYILFGVYALDICLNLWIIQRFLALGILRFMGNIIGLTGYHLIRKNHILTVLLYKFFETWYLIVNLNVYFIGCILLNVCMLAIGHQYLKTIPHH